MDVKILLALIAGVVTIAGWLINHILQSNREQKTKKRDALLQYTDKQLEKLYGPLAFLLIESKRTFQDLLEIFGRNYVFSIDHPLSEEELKTWLFWAENDFLPRNEKIKSLLMANTHLIEGGDFPESYITFLDHCNSWQINHTRWKKENIEYGWSSKINWPKEFSNEVLDTFRALRRRHASLITELRE